MVITIFQIIRQLVIFSLETGLQYAQFILYCSNMTEFTEAEIARAIGILRTNGMKLEQVLANMAANQTHRNLSNKELYRRVHISLKVWWPPAALLNVSFFLSKHTALGYKYL